MSSTLIIQLMFQHEWVVLNDALKMSSSYDVASALAASEVGPLLKDRSSCLILASVKSKNDLIQLANVVKMSKFISRECLCKIVVINFSGNKQIEKALGKLGLQDVIEEKINNKALKFKMDFWIKALNVQLRNLVAAKEVQTLKTSENAAKVAEKKAPDHLPAWVAPIDCENDIWIIQNDNDCKKILTRWLVKLMGPSPLVGQWIDVPNKAGYWKFDLKGANRDMLMASTGAWFFKGDQKPEFVWKENRWLITGSAFELFHQEDNFIISRLKLDGKTLTVAKNSHFAKTKEQIIIESFDKDLAFKQEAQSFGGNESVDNETEKLQNLSGKSKTDQLTEENLSGKGHTDQISQKDLSGKGKTSQLNSDPLSMELKDGSSIENSSSLSQKAENSKLSSQLRGKSGKEEGSSDKGVSIAKDMHNSGALLDVENSSTEHDKYMRAHNEAEKFNPSDKLGKKGKKSSEESKEGYDGKSNTDKLSSHMGGKLGEKNALESKEGHGGKSSTDKLRSDLGNPHKDPGEKAGLDSKEGYGGKSSTDKLSSHLGSGRGQSPSQRPESQNGLTGNNETEKLASHLKSTLKNESQSLSDVEKKAKLIDTKSVESPSKKNTESRDAIDRSGAKGKTPKETPAKNEADQEENDQKIAPINGKFKGGATSERAKSEFDKSETNETASLYSLAKAREEKLKTNHKDDEDEELKQATADARVVSFIIKDNKKMSCILDDFFDGKIILSLSEDELEATDKVKLDLSFNYQQKDQKLAFEADIESVERDVDGTSFVTVAVSEKQIGSFNSFMKLYQKRQDNVDVFLKRVKGI